MKKWYVSKSLWVAFIGLVWVVLQTAGIVSSPLSPETETMILAVVMFVLRLITKEPLEWQVKNESD